MFHHGMRMAVIITYGGGTMKHKGKYKKMRKEFHICTSIIDKDECKISTMGWLNNVVVLTMLVFFYDEFACVIFFF